MMCNEKESVERQANCSNGKGEGMIYSPAISRQNSAFSRMEFFGMVNLTCLKG